jgi:hypothetical protein
MKIKNKALYYVTLKEFKEDNGTTVCENGVL